MLRKRLKRVTLFLIIGLIALSSLSFVKAAAPPSPPMTIKGYVIVQMTNGTNMTATAGLNVTARQNTTTFNIPPLTPTDASGYYTIYVYGPVDGTPIDMWVQGINVTRMTFQSGGIITEDNGGNLTVLDTTAPTIQVLSPQPQAYVSSTQPVWVNATVTDDIAINVTSITMTLNQTPLAWAFNNATGLLSNQTGPLAQGFYVANITVSDIAGNTAIKTWNFTASPGIPPTISITSPTTASPVYTQSGKSIQVSFSYTEASPLNWTITISNATYTAAIASNATAITNGTSTATASVTINQPASDGAYDLAITMYNTLYLSTTATNTSAVIVDNTPPTIGTPYQDQPAPGQPVVANVTLNVTQGSSMVNVNVSVNITDAASGVNRAILSYNNGTGWVNVTMSHPSGTLYAATIPGQPNGTFVTYYITAFDNVSNAAWTPTDRLLYYQYNVIPEFNFAVLLLILAIGTTLAIVTSRTTKRKSLQSK
ncbi:MAG: hypothetical protein ABSC91_08825 [Candidatus Bathyarchaeia archaeon]|jgi:hypothetical protein